MATAHIRYRVLGPLEVGEGGKPLPLGGTKQRAALAVLLLEANSVVPRGRLIEGIWGEEPPPQAVNTIQVFISDLRKRLRSLPGDPIATRAPGYAIAVEETDLDLLVFRRLARDGRDALARDDPTGAATILGRALELWRGEPLEEFTFLPFAAPEILRLDELRLSTLEDRIDAELGSGPATELVAEVSALVASHPLRERLQRQLMIVLYRNGRQADALDVFWNARRALLDELGIQPGPDLQRVQQAVLRQDPSLEPGLAPPRSRAPRVDLPLPLTGLLGRDEQLAAVRDLIASDDCRLVTVTGVGGIGKTRLALEAARTAADAFEHGVVFVALEHARNGADVEAELASALGLDAQPAAGLAEHVSESDLLFVLDNLEQIEGAAEVVATLLRGSVRVTVLATSRTPLGLDGERLVVLPPLAVPDASVPRTPEALVRVPSVALFVQRCQRARLDFSLTSDNVTTVARIAECLEGIPLSIELAAARVTVLSPAAILERLESRLALLASRPRGPSSRHDSVRATIDWSYDLLSEGERRLYAWLGVFSGGFTLDEVEAVWNSELEALDGLGALVEASLVQEVALSSSRFRLLETVREHARERLVESGEEQAARSAHLWAFVELAERVELELEGEDQAPGLRRLDDEQENLRAAFAFALETGDGAQALRLGSALRIFWRVRGHLVEGRAALVAALEGAEGLSAELRANVSNGLGVLAAEQGDLSAARAAFDDALAFAREAGNARRAARILTNLGSLAYLEADLETARRNYEESVALGRSDGDGHNVAVGLENLGLVALAGDRIAEAIELLEESTEIAVAIGDEERRARSGRALAEACAAAGDSARAGELLTASLELGRRLGEPGLLAEAIDTVAGLAPDDGAAVALLAAADELRRSIGASPQPDQAARRKARLEAAAGKLAVKQFEAEQERGRELSVDDTVELALAQAAKLA